jgi:hypothetical protein
MAFVQLNQRKIFRIFYLGRGKGPSFFFPDPPINGKVDIEFGYSEQPNPFGCKGLSKKTMHFDDPPKVT